MELKLKMSDDIGFIGPMGYPFVVHSWEQRIRNHTSSRQQPMHLLCCVVVGVGVGVVVVVALCSVVLRCVVLCSVV